MTAEEALLALTGAGAPFEIESCEVGGVTLRCWKNAPRSLREIALHCREYGAREYLVYEDERLDFEQSFAKIATLARRLREELGIRKGDRIALAMRNYPEWALSFFAITALGAIVVPLNAWWQGEELAYALRDSGARVLIADLERYERIAPALPALAIEAVLIARAGENLPDATHRLETWLTAERGAELPELSVEADDEATIFYTSGTTGNPKGALGTHRNLISAVTSVAYVRARAALRKGVPLASSIPGSGAQLVTLLTVPLFHVMGCHSNLTYATAYGGKIVMMHKWDPERALELIERERITHVGGAPGMVFQLLEAQERAPRDISSLTGVNLGGAPAAPDLVRRIKAALPLSSASNGYGLTETSALSVSNAGADYERKPASIGLPVPICDAKVMSEDGSRELPRGETGELWIQGPNVVKGYYGNPSATAQSFGGGWLRTGDLVRMDEEGFLFVLDRQKDMLIRGGENVYCVEVENALYQHPEVIDAAVIGVPHDVLGEEVGAIVQRKPGSSLTKEALRAHAARHLAGFKVPAHIWFREEALPRNPNGKILKQQLKAELKAQKA